MMKHLKLIVLEGTDGLGKSTQAKILASRLEAKTIVQPNGDNVLGFLRHEVKNNPDYKPFERQLLHTASHIVDAYTEFQSTARTLLYPNFIMDRCHASAYVYGVGQGMSTEQNDLILKMHQAVYKDVMQHFDVRIVLLDAERRHVEGETDEFEKQLSWSAIRLSYRYFFDMLTTENRYLFSPDETRSIVDVTGLNKEQVTEKIMQVI